MINSNLPAALAAIEASLVAKNAAAAIVAENHVKEHMTRENIIDTGRLRSSITHDSDGSGFIVGTNVEYAAFVELGTRYQSPQPYLVPGLQESIGELQGIYGA